MAQSYTHIIVGAGSAGCVLANRLSADPNRNVLLLEAGGSDLSPLIHLPVGMLYLMGYKNANNWLFNADDEPGLDREDGLPLPRGRGLGGSSLLNAQMCFRGVPDDYDAWADMGLEGWSYKEILPYFKQTEQYHGPLTDARSDTGAMHIRPAQSKSPLYDAFASASELLQYPYVDDPNSGVGLNSFRLQHWQNPKTGMRCSAKVGFLNPVMDRKNLFIEKHAHATRILFEKDKAVGVEFVQKGQTKKVYCDADVILSCGSYQSPQLLMLSGIGPADHLKEHDINVLLDNDQVGGNLRDHTGTGIQYACTQPITMAKYMSPIARVLRAAQAFALGSGPFTSLPFEGGLLAKSDSSFDRPDIMYYFGDIAYLGDGMPHINEHGFFLAWQHMNPEILGNVRLRSNDPLAEPKIKHNYLAAESDMKAHHFAFDLARNVVSQKPFDAYRGRETLPGPSTTSKDDIEAYIRATSAQYYVPTGTCGMSSDHSRVTDAALNVEGVRNLRVVDGSVLPTWTTAGTQSPILMIASKASDMILGRPPLPAAA